MDQRGHGVDVAALQQQVPAFAWDTLDTWAAQRDWSILVAPPPPSGGHHHDHGH